MIADIAAVIGNIFLGLGAVFILVGAVSLLRLPDVYARIHGASVTDTLGAGFLVIGMMLHAGLSLVSVKLFFILAVFFFTLPVAAHALAKAALHEKVSPRLSEDKRSPGEKSALPSIENE